MAGQFCSKCGGQNPPGAAFCQYCGSAMPSAPSAPLPPSGPTPPPIPSAWSSPGYGGPGGYAPAGGPPRRRPSFLRIIVIVIVVVLIIAVLAYLLLPSLSSPISVSYIVFSSPDNTCGLDGAEFFGFNASLSSQVSLGFDMNNSNATATQCTIHTVSVTTPGFTLASASPLPCVVPANETVTWTVVLNTPGSDYSGTVTLLVN